MIKINCLNCYWFTGKYCEIYHDNLIYRNCINFIDDRIHSKRVKQWLMFEPEKAEANWNLLDDIDRRKFIELYGKPKQKLSKTKISVFCEK